MSRFLWFTVKLGIIFVYLFISGLE